LNNILSVSKSARRKEERKQRKVRKEAKEGGIYREGEEYVSV
jgi:hypothetical protein